MSQADSDELGRLQTTLEITHSLLSAVSSTDPVTALVARIATLCRGGAAVYDEEGRVVANTGEAPANLIWHEIADSLQPDLSFTVGRWSVRSRRVSLQDGVHVIAISSRGPETIDLIGGLLLDTAERLLGAVHGIQYGASQRDRRDNEQLLAALHDGMLPAREHRFWARMAQFQFPAYAPIRTLEISPRGETSAAGTDLTSLASSARAAGLPLLIMLHRSTIEVTATASAIVPDSPASDQWMHSLTAEYLVGSSAPTTSLTEIPTSVREAETALHIAAGWAAATPSPTPLAPVLIDRIDLSTWLLSHVSKRQLDQRIERTLAPLDSVQLRETLITYLAAEQNITRTAEALFLHPNTVRYRISRVEQALGHSITSAFGLSNAILALYPAIMGRYAELHNEPRSRQNANHQGGS
ncbi:PucR family transcriptional regulator [Leucobacter salsicius]|uniref:PucR family transcriptional regulator n=1 Tax=Leucobacter salsicius TaxID=664638 RepID=UPI00034740AD|nr:PucR family transcriptional regulator [Leucobacter salsicius]